MLFKTFRSPLRRMGALVAGVAVVLGASGCATDDDVLRTPDGSIISTTVTRIAGVNIVNAGRDYAKTCLAPTAPDAGRADVSRIVVTDPSLLDALCALGMVAQVKGVVAPAGSVPAYLGPLMAAVPTLGEKPAPDAVAEAAPDLVLSSPATAQRAAAVEAAGGSRARRVVVDTESGWKQTFTAVAAAVNRQGAATTRLADFAAEAKTVGTVKDAAHSEVSLVRFTSKAQIIEGTASFGAQIMAEIGVGRPAAQRTPKAVVATDENFADADADLIYVSFQGEKGLARGTDVLQSDRWLDMGAPTWKRVLNVDDGVWYEASGLAAAWLVLQDVRKSLNSNSAG